MKQFVVNTNFLSDTFEAAKKEVSISEDNHCTRRGLCSMSTYISDGVVVMKTMVNSQELK